MIKFGMENSKASPVLLRANCMIDKNENDKDVDRKTYESMIGSLLYLTPSLPDIIKLCVYVLYFKQIWKSFMSRPRRRSSSTSRVAMDSGILEKHNLTFVLIWIWIMSGQGMIGKAQVKYETSLVIFMSHGIARCKHQLHCQQPRLNTFQLV